MIQTKIISFQKLNLQVIKYMYEQDLLFVKVYLPK
jgi:hypothetical protein